MRMSREDIAAMRNGDPLSDPRHALVQRAAMQLWETQGRLSGEDIHAYNKAGLANEELIDDVVMMLWRAGGSSGMGDNGCVGGTAEDC